MIRNWGQKSHEFRNRVLLGSFLITSIVFAGCGDNSGRLSIEGEVSFDGEPVEFGDVLFTPLPGTEGPTGGAEIRDGTYEVASVRGLFEGSYHVELRAWKRSGKYSVDLVTGEKTQGGNLKPILPSKYNENSELSVEIAPGKQTHNFHLDR